MFCTVETKRKPLNSLKFRGFHLFAVILRGAAWVNAHKESGLNVKVRDSEALARAIKEITEDPVKYAGYCAGAKNRFNRLFKLDSMITGCENIYRSLLK